LKSTQVPDAKFAKTVAKNGCVILQPQDWIDGINNPAWMRGPRQFTGPNDPPFVYEAMYAFSVDPKPAAAAPAA
jgi:aldose 1-epimerase